MNYNYEASDPTYGIPNREYDLLRRECLRIRIRRSHDVWAESEPVRIDASRLPVHETGIERNIYYEGDGRIPDDLLGAPR